jgi:hypothetical protein
MVAHNKSNLLLKSFTNKNISITICNSEYKVYGSYVGLKDKMKSLEIIDNVKII